MDQSALYNLTEKIVEEFFPEEVIAFEVAGDKWIKDLSKGNEAMAAEDVSAEFEMGDSVQQIINCVWFLSATFNVYYQIRQQRKRAKEEAEEKKKREETAQPSLKSMLLKHIEERIDDKIAMEIIQKYGFELEEILRGKGSDQG